MKTSKTSAALASSIPARTLTPQEAHRAAFEDLVMRASRGDRNAIAAIYISFRPAILEEARRELGPFESDAEDVLHEFILLLLEGCWRYVPDSGRAADWILRTVRTIARRWRPERDRERVGP
jgi:DNA-directed RNA polymerase specialized sigma24 family protein